MSMIASRSIRKQSLYMFARGSLCGATPERGRFRSFLPLPGLTFIDFQRAKVGPFGFTTLVPAEDSGIESPFPTTHWSVVLKAGEQLHLTAGAVKVAVHRLRHRYGQLLRAEVAQTVSNSRDLEEEMHYLLELLAAEGQESREQRPFGGDSL
jgi:hypothetical protein